MTTVDVLVVGGGYAGAMAANRLARSRAVSVTLIDPSPAFTERIRLHLLAAGLRESVSIPWEQVLHPGVRRRQDAVSRIDSPARTAHLSSGASTRFDYLIYAVGSGEKTTALLSVADPISARQTAHRIADLAPGAQLTIAGGGLTSIETAAAIAAARPDLSITMVCPDGIRGGRGQVRAVRRRLDSLGVGLKPGWIDPGTGEHFTAPMEAAGGGSPPADATIWTAGFSYPQLALDSGLPTTPQGRLIVGDDLSVEGSPHIIAAGDAAHLGAPGLEHHRPSCAAALPLGRQAASTVLARVSGADPRPARVRYALQCLDLGLGQGHIQVVSAADEPRPLAVTGRPGGWIKEAVCRSTVQWLKREARA